jgi:predicted dehydrogenase
MRRTNTDVVADLVFHDLAILLYLVDADPEILSVSVSSSLWPDLCDTASLHLMVGACPVHIGLSWTLPERRRDVVVFDREKMVRYDELAADKLTAHWSESGRSEVIPFAETGKESLAHVVDHFLECVASGSVPRSGPTFMRRVLTAYERVQAARPAQAIGLIQ